VGPLVSVRGEVIGINSAIASETGFYSGYGFAIPDESGPYGDDAAHRDRRGSSRRPLASRSTMCRLTMRAYVGLPEIRGVVVKDIPTDDSPAKAGRHRAGRYHRRGSTESPSSTSASLQQVIGFRKPGDVVKVESREGRVESTRPST